jgi:nucleotide-binding universal stress UspA family protein
MVPFDFSKESKMALRAALKIGKALEMRLEVMQFKPVAVPSIMPTTGTMVGYGAVVSQVGVEEVKFEGLDEFLRVLEEMNALERDVHFHQVEESPLSGIKEFMHDHDPSLVVLHKKSFKGGNPLSGSVAQRVIRHANTPVLALEGNVLPESFKNIVLPTDVSRFLPKEADFISRWVDSFNSTVHLVNVVHTDLNDDEEIKAKMQRVALELGFEKFFVNATHHDEEVEAIVEFSQKVDADLIMMKTYDKNGLERLLFGSITEDVVKASSPAVLAVNVSMN